ncbi:alpha/beta hydrolase [Streptomyces sp. NPDC006355]|uniref:alpha/beta fold hydrolase n=1 Tax=Streptomyces sp. NPDC006355 TaxID=3156758 RepID=UPI0033A229BB
MSEVERAGTRLSYEVSGAGAAVLLLAPPPTGLVDEPDPSDTRRLLAQEFRVIAPHPRHSGRGAAPLQPFSYERSAEDQMAVLDELGVEGAHVVAFGSGCAQAWALAERAPQRVRSLVCVEPAGLADGTVLGDFHAPFDEAMRTARAAGVAGVLELADREGAFALAPGAGPFAAALRTSVESRTELSRLSVERYVVLLGRYRDGLWPAGSPYFSVTEESMRRLAAPLSVVPGSTRTHPEGLAKALVRDVLGARLSGRGPERVAEFLTECAAS